MEKAKTFKQCARDPDITLMIKCWEKFFGIIEIIGKGRGRGKHFSAMRKTPQISH